MSQTTPKVSNNLKRIEYTLTRRIPWSELLQLFDVKTISKLETQLGFAARTLGKIYENGQLPLKDMRSDRGISAKSHQKLLDAIAGKFGNEEKFRAWIEEHWDVELQNLAGNYLETLCRQIDIENQNLE